MNEVLVILLGVVLIVLCACSAVSVAYIIHRDTKSKEQMFEIQLTAAKSKNIKDALSPDEMYKVVNTLVHFYVSKTIALSDLEGKSDSELSILLDNIIVSISTEIELHLSDTFKRSWETYFDPVDGTEDVMSHLKIYIAYSVRVKLIQIIEKSKSSIRLSASNRRRKSNIPESDINKEDEQN